jgi:PKD domain
MHLSRRSAYLRVFGVSLLALFLSACKLTAQFEITPQDIIARQEAAFDATASMPKSPSKEQKIVSYSWQFGDVAASTTPQASGMIVKYTYAKAGKYTVVLTVTDAKGKTDTLSKTIEVKEPPSTEDLTPGLKGIDADANGIRDDIDRLIATKFSQTPAIKKAAEQTAIALQLFMEATTKEQAFEAGQKNGRATACVAQIVFILPYEQRTLEEKIAADELFLAISREIEALTANTKERMVKYLASNKLVGGGVFPQALQPVCD